MSHLRIAHLSDPHFGTILPGMEEALLASLAQLSPGLVLLTGDITQRAEAHEFRAARSFVEKLGNVPLIALPGNHDIPIFNVFDRIFRPYKSYRELFVDHLEKDHRHGDVKITGLASTSRWRHIQGRLKLDRVKSRLEREEKEPKSKVHIVAFHHPMDCRLPQDEKNLLRGRERTIDLFEENSVDLILGGHIHDPFLSLSPARYPSVKRAMILAVAGTCLSRRTRSGSPNSFHLIDVDTTSLPRISIGRVELGLNRQFAQTAARSYHRDSAGNWMTAAAIT